MSGYIPYSFRGPRFHRTSPLGQDNNWHQSKTLRNLRREQQLEFIQRKLKRKNQEQIEENGKSHIIPGALQEVTLNILLLELLEKQGFQVTYDGNRYSLSLMFKDKEIKRFDEDRLRRMHNHYMQEYFESISKEGEGLEQDTVRIKGNIYTIKFNLLMILAHRQGNIDTMLEPTRRDRECLGYHQGKIGEDGAHWRRPAVLKGKEIIEHFDVQLEDTNKSPEEPTQGHYKGV
nr:hypothetical protein [Tanacetum cinerariifolium]